MHIKNLSLTEFTFKELNWLYLTLEEKRKDLHSKIELAESMDSSGLRSEIIYDLTQKLHNCTQFQTKVDEAQKYVKAREISESSN